MPTSQRSMIVPATRAFFPRLVRHLQWRWSQVSDIPRILFRRHGSRFWNDRVLARHRKLSAGKQEMGKMVVVYVVFAPNGILPSHRNTLAKVCAAGYATVVVANGGLTDADRDILLDDCALLLERANFGYDFGAYRDAIRLLGDRVNGLERLVLVNDSVWFPLRGEADWFARAEEVQADCVGASSNLGVVPTPLDRWPEQRWHYDQSQPDFHLCSFLLSFSPKVLTSDAFASFWASLPLSSNKFWVVAWGEVELSRRLHASGFTLGTTTPLGDLDKRLEHLSLARLRQLLSRLIIPEDPVLRAERDLVLERFSSSARKETEAFILHAVAATGPAYALADLAVCEFGQPFLKKTPLTKSPESAAASISILQDIGAADILAEARTLAARSFFA